MDQFYFVDDYLVDDYFAYIAEAEISISSAFTPSISVDIADDTGYYIPDYIETDYIEAGGTLQEASASLSVATTLTTTAERILQGDALLTTVCSASILAARTRDFDGTFSVITSQTVTAGKILQFTVEFAGVFASSLTANALKNHTAILDSQSNMSVQAEKLTDTNVTLANIVNLSLQGDKIAGAQATVSAQATISTVATKQVTTTLALDSAFVSSTNGGLLLSDSATLALSADLEAYSRYADERPYTATYSDLQFVDFYKQFGSYSAYAFNGRYATFEPRGKNFVPHRDGTTDYDLSVDFWVFSPDASTQIVACYNTADDDLNWQVGTNSSNYLRIVTEKGGGTQVDDSATAWDSGWNHVRVIFEQTDEYQTSYSVYLNGTRVVLTSTVLLSSSSSHYLVIGDPDDSTYVWYIDELRIMQSLTLLADQGWSLTDTSITVPTQQFVDTEATQLLLHFENNILDDNNTVFEFASDLNTQATVNATITGSVRASATLATTSALSVVANEIQQSSAQLNSVATVDATANFITNASATISGAAAFSISADVIIPGDFYVQGQFTLDSSATRSRDVPATLDSVASLTASGLVDPGLHASISASASLSSSPRVIDYLNWLPRRSVVTFEATYKDLTVDDLTGVTNNGIYAQYGVGGWPTDPYSDSDYGFAGASATQVTPGVYAYYDLHDYTVSRTTGKFNTVIGTDDFAIDFYVLPYLDNNYFMPLVSFPNSTNDIEFGITYDQASGAGNDERINFIWRENGSDVYSYNWTIGTNGAHADDWYIDGTPRWQYFRIQRVDGTLSVKWSDDTQTNTVTTVITDTYTENFGNSYKLLGGDWTEPTYPPGGGIPTLIDWVNLQIESPGYPVQVASEQPDRTEWYTAEYQIGGELIARSTLTANTLKVLFGEINANVTATVSADNARTRNPGAITPSVVASMSVDAVKVTTTSASLLTAITAAITPVKTVGVLSTQSVVATSSVQGDRARLTGATLSTQFAITTQPSVTKTDIANLNSAFILPNVDYIRYRDSNIDTDAIASALTVAAKVGDFFVNADLRATMSVTARKTTNTPIELNSVVSTDFEVIKSVKTSATISAQASLTASVDKIRAASATLNSAFTSDSTANKITDSVIPLDSTFTHSVAFTRVRFTAVGLNTLATINAVGDRVRFGVISLNVSATILATPFRVQRTSASLSAFAFNITAGDIIHLDPFRTLIVPQETRYIKVLEETRDLVVDEETRVLIV